MEPNREIYGAAKTNRQFVGVKTKTFDVFRRVSSKILVEYFYQTSFVFLPHLWHSMLLS
jgi:hypothetical protein